MLFQYQISLVFSEEDNGYVATIPEFPGMSGFGLSSETAVQELKTAVDLAIRVMEADGAEIPDPEIVPDKACALGSYKPNKSLIKHKLNEAAELIKKSDQLLSEAMSGGGADTGCHFDGGTVEWQKQADHTQRLLNDAERELKRLSDMAKSKSIGI